MEETSTKTPQKSQAVTTKKRAGIYFIIGVTITVSNYLLYTIIANLIIKNNDLLWLSTLIATFIITFLAYFLHSRITWKERVITKTTIYKFFIWNLALAFLINPLLTQLFSYFTPLYDLAKSISEAIHLDFSYDFIQSTGAFILAGIVIMIINFLFYDKFVFGKRNSQKQ
ncbi:hypothetical protein IKE97_02940 [Candidatus Saccharibacteria bacterium]|nr:hypothetical protein [Candidatus Saccharibacteria bacterium]